MPVVGAPSSPADVGRSVRPSVVLDGRGADPALVGGKAAALDRLIGWGLPVPATAVVTSEAYRVVAADPNVAVLHEQLAAGVPVDATDVDDVFGRSAIPDGLRQQIVSTARRVACGRLLAVRSSATIEDLDHASFAGQYRSVLHVDPAAPHAVIAAVLAVMASLHHPAPRAYRAALGLDDSTAAMAVILMPMIAAEQAGVVFTQDPAGDPGTVRIEVADGVADALVSGRTTPRVLLVQRGSVSDDLASQISELYALAMHIEGLAGGPQDVEWAWDGSTVWIVQARPVTVLGIGRHDEFDDSAGLDGVELTTAGIGEMLAGVLPPLRWQVCSYLAEEALRSILDDVVAMPDDLTGPRLLVRRVKGRAALDVGRLSQAMAAIPGFEDRLHEEYFGRERSRPPRAGGGHEARLAAMLRRARSAGATRRASFDADVVAHAASELTTQRCELSGWPVRRLFSYHLALLDLGTRAMAAELAVTAHAGAIHDGLRAVLQRYLEPDEAGRQADRLTVPDGAIAVPPDASAAVFAGPTWAELRIDPAGPAPLPAGGRDRALDDLSGVLEAVPGWPEPGIRRRLRLRRIERLAVESARELERRERTKATIMLVGGVVRQVHLELGRRLVAAGDLTSAEDVELLTLAEVRRAFAGRRPDAASIERRRRWRERHELDGSLPPHFTGLPPAIPESADPTRSRLTGWPASGGTFTGIARCVNGPGERIGSDEVLVASATDPSWSPLLMRCGAMVIERGGPLSHAAILAREFRIPAVFNVPGATQELDGRHVAVDGDTGVVAVLDDEVAR